jgi:ATP-binding cassette subfamily C protein
MVEYLKKIRPLLRPGDGPLLALFLVLAIIAGFSEMLGVGLFIGFVALIGDPGGAKDSTTFGFLHDALGAMAPGHMLMIGAGAILAFVLVKNLFLAALNFYKFWFVTKRQIDLSRRLFRAYMLGDYEQFTHRNSGEILRNVNEEAGNLFFGFVDPTLNLIAEAVVVIALLGLMVIVEPQATLVTAITLCVCGFAIHQVVTRVSPRYGAKRVKHLGEMNKWVNQGIGGFKEARVLGREAQFVDNYAHHARNYAVTDAIDALMHLLPRFAGELTLMVGFFAITVALLTQGRAVADLLPPLALFGAAGMRLMPSFNRIMANFHELSFNSASVAEVLRDLETFEGGINRRNAVPAVAQLTTFAQEIRFDNVTSRYLGGSRSSLRDVSFSIPAGSSVAFVGPTGSGKSTLIDHIIGLLVPESGKVEVDGQDLQYQLQAWHSQLGYIPQSIYLCDDSLSANIAFGVPPAEIDEPRVWQCLEIAQLADFVREQPAGLAAVVGERGIRLSGGQRQRIGIARALYHDPPVLILDEATAALDTQTETNFLAALEQFAGAKTMIFVAHRLSTIRHCDRIYLIEDGAICAEGRFDDLLRRSTTFKKLAVGR